MRDLSPNWIFVLDIYGNFLSEVHILSNQKRTAREKTLVALNMILRNCTKTRNRSRYMGFV